MSNRILIGLILTLSAGTAAGENGELGTTNSHPTVRLADSDWLLYRPPAREATIHDPDFMMDHLRSDQAGIGLHFGGSPYFRLDFTLAPLVERADYIGPIYDMNIGATRLTLSFSF